MELDAPPETRSPDSMPWEGELPQALRLEMESLAPSLAACFHETVEPWNRLDVHNCLKHWGGWYFYEDSPGSSHPNEEDNDLIVNCRFYIAALLHEVDRQKRIIERGRLCQGE